MKKLIIICLGVALLLVTSCASSKAKTDTVKEHSPSDSPSAALRTPSVNHSYLTEDNVGDVISVKGKLQVNGSSFTLTENASSKSRVTFVLEVNSESLETKLKELSGTTVTVSGELTQATSTWTKKMKVLSVE